MRHIAIIGSGPAGYYTAEAAQKQWGDNVRVDIFDMLPVPYGLIRTGVAPDHQNTKRVTGLFDRVSGHRRFRFYLNVEIGKHLSHADLLAHHHAVLYAVGAPDDRRLDIDGMGLPGTGTATELVARTGDTTRLITFASCATEATWIVIVTLAV